ncbi:MAG: FAD-binding oxidoreductase [Methyloceanibacter sp.]|uniref:FAD-binding oxidoreductase n=1 Tax=Methyloceanibacter sp. TaxID=1965321 RepID=UPI003D6CD351
MLRRDSFDFTRIAAPWNLRFASVVPAGIARCGSADDVRTALLWAEANNVPLAIRSGGHSYAGFSTTAGLLIDVSPMSHVAFDGESGRARLGGGARNTDVHATFARLGRSITHGRCQGVGVAGLVLGGGVGFSQRLRGLTCDRLIETEIVTASGELLRCSAEENADLFWACRGGGGGNFGVNTSFTFDTFPVGVVTVFRLVWTSRLSDVLPALLDHLPAMPDRFGCKFLVDAGQAERLELLGQFVGTEGEVTALLAPLLRSARPAQQDMRTLPYWDAQDFLSEDDTPEYVHERSRYLYRIASAEGARTILDYLRRFPGTHAGANWKVFLAGGAVAKVAPDATAFVHRQALMLSSIELNWTADDDAATLARNESWLAEFHAAMQPHASAECYQNFIDPAETNYLRAYYGTNLERLVEIKRRYDPRNVFRFAQSIPLSL